jgi:hypothetical protein
MPYTWLSFSTMTAPAIKDKTPCEITEYVRELAGRSGGTLLNVYFDVGKEVAYALIKDLGDSVDTKRASRDLGGVGFTKLIDCTQFEDALAGLPGGDEGAEAAV